MPLLRSQTHCLIARCIVHWSQTHVWRSTAKIWLLCWSIASCFLVEISHVYDYGTITIYDHNLPMIIWLVVYLPLWKTWVRQGYDIPNIWKVIKFRGSKPPTIIYLVTGITIMMLCIQWLLLYNDYNYGSIAIDHGHIPTIRWPYFGTKKIGELVRRRRCQLSPSFAIPGPGSNIRRCQRNLGFYGQFTSSI